MLSTHRWVLSSPSSFGLELLAGFQAGFGQLLPPTAAASNATLTMRMEWSWAELASRAGGSICILIRELAGEKREGNSQEFLLKSEFAALLF